MIIAHNMMAMNTHRQLGINNSNSQKSIEKLSSGQRINRAGDDAAGLSISEKMRSQIRGLNQASRNSQDGISMIQTAEGALQETHEILQRMRELAIQASNGTNVETDRESIQKEIDQLTDEIDRIANNTEFNKQKILKGANTDAAAATEGAEGTDAAAGTTTPATAGSVTGTVDLSTFPDISSKDLKITIDGGTETTVNISSLDSSKGIDDLVSAINGTTGLDGIASKSDDGKNIIITSKTTGESSSVLISGAAATDLGLSTTEAKGAAESTSGGSTDTTESTDSTESSSSKKFTTTLQVGSNSGQTFEMEIEDMRAEALGLKSAEGADATEGADGGEGTTTPATAGSVTGTVDLSTFPDISSKDLKITIDGGTETTVNISSLDSSKGIDDLVSAINGTTGLDGIASKSDDGKNIIITSKTTGESSSVLISGAAAADLGLSTTEAKGAAETTSTSGGSSSSTEATGATLSGTADLSTFPDLSSKTLEITVDGGSKVTVDISSLDSSKGIDDLVSAINGTTGLDGIASKSDDGNSIVLKSTTTGESSSLLVGGTAATDLGLSTEEVKGTAAAEAEEEAAATNGIDVTTTENASKAIDTIDKAIASVSAQRSKLGAYQNRLEHTIKNLDTSSENLQAAESRIRDVDMAKEMMNHTKNNILAQAAQAMLAQANQAPQGVLQLLR